MMSFRSVFPLPLLYVGCSRPHASNPPQSASLPQAGVRESDSLPLCERGADGKLSNMPCLFVRDGDIPNNDGVAVVMNGEIVCPVRLPGDSVAKLNHSRL